MSRYRNVTIPGGDPVRTGAGAGGAGQGVPAPTNLPASSACGRSARLLLSKKPFVWFQNGVGDIWSNYVYLRGVRQENRDLKFEIERLRLEQVRLSDDAQQARRLQALLGFKEQYIAKTVAAQVIGSSGSEQSRSIYIDKGTSAGVEKDMAVITADGLVGKVLRAFGSYVAGAADQRPEQRSGRHPG